MSTTYDPPANPYPPPASPPPPTDRRPSTHSNPLRPLRLAELRSPSFAFPGSHSYRKMTPDPSPPPPTHRRRGAPYFLVASYVFDWLVLVALGVAGAIMGKVTPNKRPFSLTDPNISFPFTEHETVPTLWLTVTNAAAPILIIFAVTMLLVPGATVPKGTPKSMIWRRKLWELHVGWLGLCLALASAWFITNGMKNMFGKPRPDLLSRCQPDLERMQEFIVGGIAGASQTGQLVSADICTSTNKSRLDDGFRSFPSGHSSSAAAGLIYLSLFLASKFSVTIPFFAPTGYPTDSSAFTAFPSRIQPKRSGYESVTSEATKVDDIAPDPTAGKRIAEHNRTVIAVRRQAAAPPLYLLVLTLLPFFTAVFIASSRWFDFRHHGFDILFGFLIGVITSIYSFRYYHLPISQGAGWGWGPRSSDKAFWAGVGSYSYATEREDYLGSGSADEGLQLRDLEASRGHNRSPSEEESGRVEEGRIGQ